MRNLPLGATRRVSATADTRSAESRRDWFKTLEGIERLSPAMVIPGHYLPNADGTNPFDGRSVAYSRDYLKTFETEAARAADSPR